MEQPPLSRQLRLMETELGVKLFDRVGKHLILTQAGYVLETRAKNLLHQLDETLIEVKKLTKACAAHWPSAPPFLVFRCCRPKLRPFAPSTHAFP